jgi:hypothetical protein
MTASVGRELTIGLLILVGPSFLQAQSETLVFRVQGPGAQAYSIAFETNRITKREMEQLAWLAPRFPVELRGPFQSAQSDEKEKVFVAPSLELCVDGDPSYAPCGTRDLSDPNFFRNAEVNLEKGRREILLLSTMAHPNQLDPVVRYLRENLKLSLWLEETRIDFYKTWNVRVLERRYSRFDPTAGCAAVLRAFRGASKDQAYKLARYDWHNCMLQYVSTTFGHYPIKAWRRFLDDYGIRESYRIEAVE